MESLLAIIFSFAALMALWFFSRKMSRSPKVTEHGNTQASRIRLTNQQIIALTSASFEHPIFGENPKFRAAQMPNGAPCFALKTIEFLVKRGYLEPAKTGGYLLTGAGAEALRSAMGF